MKWTSFMVFLSIAAVAPSVGQTSAPPSPPTPSLAAGIVEVAVLNQWGTSTPPGANGLVKLYNSGGTLINTVTTNASGVAVLSGVPDGTGYSIKVYHEPPISTAPTGEEYWGERTGITVITGNTSSVTFNRSMPVNGADVQAYRDDTGEPILNGGSIPLGKTVRVVLTIANPGPSQQSVTGRLILDLDRSLPYDFDQNGSPYKTLAGSGTVTSTLYWTPTRTGSYSQATGSVTNVSGTPWVTDGWGWSPSIIVVDQQTTGTLSVKVQYFDGSSRPLPGPNGLVRLYDAGGAQVASQATDSGGIATMTMVPAGVNYTCRVFYTPQNPATPLGQEYWGKSTGIAVTAGGSTSITFTRDMPYHNAIKWFNNSTQQEIPHGGTITLGTTVRSELTIVNPGSTQQSVTGRILFDLNRTLPYDHDYTSPSYSSVTSGGTTLNTTYWTPAQTGAYYGSAGTITNVEGTPQVTNGWAWEGSNPSIYVVDVATISVTVTTNPTGRAITVDGFTSSSPQVFNWTPGSSHTISTTATQAAGADTQYVWANWSDTGAITHTVAPTSNMTYTANFSSQYRLTMNAGSGGSVAPPTGWFVKGQSVQITATPGGGYNFSGWTGTGNGSYSGMTNPVSVTMNGPITEGAGFVVATWTINASAGAGGSISPSGSVTVNNGVNQSFTISPNTNYQISSVTVDGANQGAISNYTFTNVISNHSIAAAFALIPPGITVQTYPAGLSITVDGNTYTSPQTFQWISGSNHTIGTTATQAGGTGVHYVWSSWSDAGAMTHVVTPTTDMTYTANFTTQFLLTMNAESGGTVNPTGGWYNSGQSVQITATPNNTFTFVRWTGSGAGSYSGTANPTNITMNGPITENASFAAATVPPPTARPATDLRTTSFQANWDAVSGATVYTLDVSSSNFTSSLNGYPKDVGNVTQYQVTGLTPGTLYAYRVLTEIGGIKSDPSNVIQARTYVAGYAVSEPFTYTSHTSLTDYGSPDYQLVGIPGNSGKDLGTFLQGAWKQDWQAYWDNGKAGTKPEDYYVEYQQGNPTFASTVGKAFWVLHKGGWTLKDSVAAAPLDANGCAVIPLTPGQKWNLIVNPFGVRIPWTAVAAYNGIGSAVLRAYQMGWTPVTEMLPCAGYLFANDLNKDSLRFPYRFTIPGVTQKADVAQSGWTIDVVVHSGAYHDRTTWFGVREGAEPGKDLFEQYKPRHVGMVPDVFFDRPEWDRQYNEFSTDVRPVLEGLGVWDMKVRSDGQKSVEMEFRGAGTVPEELAVCLIDERAGRSLDLRKEAAYTLQLAGTITPLKVLVGRPEDVEKSAREVVPLEFALGSNYPNPFNPTTTIPVAIASKGSVTLEVWNILGQRVRELFRGDIEPGRYSFVWDGTDDAGSAASTGMYVYTLSAPGRARLAQRMLLVR
jgi:hypothetical protein